MKKKTIRVSAALVCMAVAVMMAVPAFANTVGYNTFLGALQVSTGVASGQKAGENSENMRVRVSTVGNDNDGFNSVTYKVIGGVGYRETNNRWCPLGTVTTINYNHTGWTGQADMYGWAQYFGFGPTYVTGEVAFH